MSASATRQRRASGVLLHPTSLPGPHGSGDLGAAAYHFVDWLVAGAQQLWQMLPLGCVGLGHSPYMSPSAFAGNLLLIDLGALQRAGWLDEADLQPLPEFADGSRVDHERVIGFRLPRLARAAERFAQRASPEQRAEFQDFCRAQSAWLDDFALFMALDEAHPGLDWCDWPPALARRDPAALAAARAERAGRIAFWQFTQWCFFTQWAQLRRYAHQRGVQLVGDVPIFIAHHSADVWARPGLFLLDAAGRPTVVAGVPPDLFAATGQRWGNPLYRWEAHAQDGYAWWVARIRQTLALVDRLRIDHFRGFAAHWEIPADEPTAIHGRWVPGPGAALFRALRAALGEALPIIAEDLGVITPDVVALRHELGLPGMGVLQFAFGPGGEERFLPHNLRPDMVVYTGTHDNDTTLGWWASASEAQRHHLREYLASDGGLPHWDLIRAASASVAETVVFPLQDVLNLGGEHRMNLPGVKDGNWAWRFRWDQVGELPARQLRRLAELYGRLPA
jgi:4-alpha-glucanotransferase